MVKSSVFFDDFAIGVVNIRRIIPVFALILVFTCSCAAEPESTPQLRNAPPEFLSSPAPAVSQSPEPSPVTDDSAEFDETVAPADTDDHDDDPVKILIDSMTLDERVSQLFILALDSGTTAPSDNLEEFIGNTRAGGYVLFKDNITTVEGTRALTDVLRNYSALTPFICIDEEGGSVSRLYSANLPGYGKKPSAASIGSSGDTDKAFTAGRDIGNVLASIGVTVDFAPVADVLTNPGNTAIKSRSFSSDPVLAGDMTAAFIDGLHAEGILSAAKHFPGHGNTTDDTHLGYAVIASDTEHLRAVEYLPFIRAIERNTAFIMTGHITAPNADESGLPATLSEYFVTDVLRNELGFTGIVVTDAMNMGAITNKFTPGEAAVMAISAGVDMILMPEDFYSARDAVIRAVEDGVISLERIEQSLLRIIRAKTLRW